MRGSLKFLSIFANKPDTPVKAASEDAPYARIVTIVHQQGEPCLSAELYQVLRIPYGLYDLPSQFDALVIDNG